MFLGHVAAGLAAKRVAPRTSTAVLLGAPLLLDLIWPPLLLLGIEHVQIDPGNTAYTPLAFTHYPYSHSLLLALVWSVFAGLVYVAATKYRRGALVVGALVLSHWVLDWVTHRPDLPLYPGGPEAGLGLWNSVAGTVIVETGMYVAGIALFLSATRAGTPRSVQSRLSFWSLVALLAVISVANLVGPPPPDTRAIAIVGFALWLIPLWGLWIDRYREPRV